MFCDICIWLEMGSLAVIRKTRRKEIQGLLLSLGAGMMKLDETALAKRISGPLYQG